jgi:flagellar biogenesis protein FliO
MNGAENLALLGRVMGGLVVVLVLIGLAARVARRTRGLQGTTGLRVIDRIGLSREANLTVVEVADRVLLLGVTAQGVTLVADLDPALARGSVPAEEREAEWDDAPERDDEISRSDSGVQVEAPAPERAFVNGRVLGGEPLTTQRRPLPSGVSLEEYPDLASALRAAGRTAGSDESTSTPRTRSEARAEARARAAAAAQAQDQALAGSGSGQVATRSDEVARVPTQRTKSSTGPKKRVVPPKSAKPASGSVLSPRTWRQGIEALRDLTVRRG